MAHAFGWPAVVPRGRSRLWLAGILALAGWFGFSVLRIDVDPVLARSCPTVDPTVTIQNGSASPGSGTTATTFSFAVWFADSTGAAPQSVKLWIAEGSKALQPTGTDYTSGVKFVGSRKLPAGTWSYHFVATYGDGQTCDHARVDPATVTVSPAPTPTPRPTPKPTPTPTAAPKATPKATPKPTPRATARPSAAASPSPVAQPSAAPSATSSPVPAAVVIASPGNGDSSGGGGGGGLQLAAGPLTDALSLALPLIALAGAIVGGFLLLLTRRRRRDQPAPDGGGLAVDGGALALDAVPLGPPPSLIPAAIFRQVLFDPMELTPIWAKPRQDPEPEPAQATEEAAQATEKPKPARRASKPKATGTGSASGPTKPAKPRTPRRPRKGETT